MNDFPQQHKETGQMGGPHFSDAMRRTLAHYTHMRREEPVSHDPRSGRWQVFRYADGLRVMQEAETFSNDMSEFMPSVEELVAFQKGNFQNMDMPRHRELRGLVSQAFTPRFVESLEPRIGEVTRRLLDAAEERGDTIDIVSDLAHPLPVTVIAEVMGLPREDHGLFRKWAYALLVDNGVDAIRSEEGVTAMAPSIREMNDYLGSHVRRHRARSGDGLIHDLIRAEADGRRLDDQEIVGFLGLMLIAGFLTTSALLGNAVLCLDEHPKDTAELRKDPGLLPSAIEEVLRYRSPLIWLDRRAARDTRLSGHTVPEGALVSVALVSTARDPEAFPDPDTFDIARRPNRHLSFGKGAHVCLGAPLARLEARVALTELLTRYPDFAVSTTQPPQFHDPEGLQAPSRLPLRVTRIAGTPVR
ncbi:cytochrome P450 [Streptomyces sp. NPDC051572]|uniref:cytochrome P450 n=1 Tax=unclassified Streptomyces TaxID=2593676 RepID=UPI00344B6060